MAAKVHKENQFSPNPRETGLEKEAFNQREGQHVDALQLQWLRLNSLFQHNEEGRILQKNGSSLERTENDKVRTFGFSAETRTSTGEIWSANSGVEPTMSQNKMLEAS